MIAVLMGGNSAERAVSLDGGNAIYRALKNQAVDCFKFDWCGNNLSELWTRDFDRAFIILHGRGGEDGTIQQQLEKRNIAYTGSNSSSSKRCINKDTTKTIWNQHRLPVPPWALANIGHSIPKIEFSLPWAIKPILEGSSIGISKVRHLAELDKALALAWQYDSQVLIEKWIEGEEYSVTILNGGALPAIKIVTNQGFYDYESKYHSDKTRYLCPCGLTDAGEQRLQKIALKAFNVLGAKTWGRIDFIIDSDNNPQLLEINTIPGMTQHSLAPMAAKAAGLSFDALVLSILNA